MAPIRIAGSGPFAVYSPFSYGQPRQNECARTAPDAATIFCMPNAARRRGSDSRCCNASDGPWIWIDYVGEAVAVQELETWLDSLGPWAKAHELGRIDDLMEAAALGRLEDSGDAVTPIKPIRRDPEVFELRLTALSKKLRFYHGEPPESPAALIALHRHIKVNDEHQQAQVVLAVERYDAGRPTRWGTAEQP